MLLPWTAHFNRFTTSARSSARSRQRGCSCGAPGVSQRGSRSSSPSPQWSGPIAPSQRGQMKSSPRSIGGRTHGDGVGARGYRSRCRRWSATHRPRRDRPRLCSISAPIAHQCRIDQGRWDGALVRRERRVQVVHYRGAMGHIGSSSSCRSGSATKGVTHAAHTHPARRASQNGAMAQGLWLPGFDASSRTCAEWHISRSSRARFTWKNTTRRHRR